VANAFKGFAREWLFSTADMLDWTEAQLTWTNLKPRFQKQFATQTDNKQIIQGLSNLALGSNETTGELLARITNLMVIIKELLTTTKFQNHLPTLMGLDRWDCWGIRQSNGPPTWLTTCCSSSRCSFSKPPYQGI
jgi:hypothetical protein